jgi:formiminoglutamate deiminase
VTRFHAEHAWLGGPGVTSGVLIEVQGGTIASVATGVTPPPGTRRLRGLTLPGLANAHSHAFHRLLRGRSQAAGGDFWTWRHAMYAMAARLTPERYHRVALAVYAEMALAGVTCVGEFHYLHHRPDGRPYDDPNEMGHALVGAAGAAGLRITLLDTCYLTGGIDRPLEGVQRRFGDADAAGWAERVGALEDSAGSRVGAAVHSVRAVPPESAAIVAEWARARAAPLHFHLSEQPAENRDCVARYGRTPAEVLEAAEVLGAGATAVHATHLGSADVDRLGASATTVCACPTTERDLADGIGPLRALARAGCPLALGSDSHAVIDLLEEARALELDERLGRGRRGNWAPHELLSAATVAGHRALGWPSAGRLVVGAPADLVSVDLASVRTAGTGPDLLATVVYAAAAADVTDVVVGGREVVRDGCHLLVPEPARALTAVVAELEGDR